VKVVHPGVPIEEVMFGEKNQEAKLIENGAFGGGALTKQLEGGSRG